MRTIKRLWLKSGSWYWAMYDGKWIIVQYHLLFGAYPVFFECGCDDTDGYKLKDFDKIDRNEIKRNDVEPKNNRKSILLRFIAILSQKTIKDTNNK